jgi:hypothetical protein
MVMRMEADRMANLRLTERELIPERQVVLEERRMRIDNSPAALLGEAVQEQLYGRHKPYGMPISGYVDDVKKLNIHDLAAFYAKWYMPNNAILIVAGDTTADQVRKLAEKHYGPIAARKVDPRRRPGEGASDLPQRVARADSRVAEPRWSRYYLAPSYHKGESQYAYALQVLARLLGGGETSRLWKTLVVDRKLALSAWASYSPSSLGLTSFDLGVHPASGMPMVEVESAVGGLLGKLIDDGVTPEEVERAQNQLLAAASYSQDSLQSGPRIYGGALGRQMNQGAKTASGDILLFLHADVTLPVDAVRWIRSTLATPDVVAGAFRTWTVADGDARPFWSPLLHLADLRSRYTGLPYGDQAVFVRRDVFQAIGGFADLDLMEDLDLCRRLRRRGRIVTVPSSVVVSGRKFLARPVFYTIVMNVLPLLNRLGVSERTLGALYGHVR